MSEEQPKPPFKALGQRLKAVRQRLHESLPEVSGAVEIDTDLLERIEHGVERPSEDILQLLINHFDIHEEAENLWRLAGYEAPNYMNDFEDVAQQTKGNTLMIMAMDPRVVYSDQMHISANRSGVVLNFVQRSNVPNPLVAARVGMSREQASEVARTIQQALQRSEPPRLQQPKPKTEDTTDNSQSQSDPK